MVMMMSAPLSPIELNRIFNKLDKNGDGLVSLEELVWLLDRLGLHTSPDELKLLLAGKTSLDCIDFQFFYQDVIVNNHGRRDEEEEEEDGGDDGIQIIGERDLQKAFMVFDLNGDGFISSEELQSALAKLGLWDEGDDDRHQSRTRKMISLYDTNSDGLLDFHEFKNMMLTPKT